MPGLGKNIGLELAVDNSQSDGYSLVVNRESGNWAVLNAPAINMLNSFVREISDNPDKLLDLNVKDKTGFGPDTGINRLLLRNKDEALPSKKGESFFVIYKLTHDCNFSCAYCYDGEFQRRKSASRRDAVFEKLVEKILSDPANSVFVLFHGGEPLLEFETIRIVVEKFADRFGSRLSFSVQTNGALLNEEIMRFLTSHGVGLSISIDGVTPDDNALRTNIEGIDPYENVLRLSSGHGPVYRGYMGLHLTITPHNLSRLDKIMVQLEKDGFRSVSFNLYQPAKTSRFNHEKWDPNELVKKMVELVDLANQGTINSCGMHYLIQLTLRVLHVPAGSACLSSPCGAGRNLVTIYPSGELSPCDSLFEAGLIFDSLESYENAKTDSHVFRSLLSRNINTIPQCMDCDLKRFCNGTCPGSARLSEGGPRQVNPFECGFYFNMNRRLMRIVTDSNYKGYLDYCRNHINDREKLRRKLKRGTGN